MKRLILGFVFTCHALVASADQFESIEPILKSACHSCHNADTTEGDLNLVELSRNLDNRAVRRHWVLIHDRIAKGEMPPPDETLSREDRESMLRTLSGALHKADYQDVSANGRGPIRRLTRREFQQNLRDLLKLPHLDLEDMLPPDREKFHCNKVADALDVSRVQLAAYLNASDKALRNSIASGVAPRKSILRRFPATAMFQEAGTFGGREAMFYAKDSQHVPLSRADLDKIRKDNSHDAKMELAIFRSPSWPYYGYPAGFVATQPGAYKVRFSARAVRQVRDFRLRPAHDSIPMTFRARKRSGPDVSGDVRATGGMFDIQPDVAIYETTIRLKKNETFEYSLLGLPVPRAINPPDGPLYYDFPPMPENGHPGIAFQWLELTGPIDSKTWPPESHRVLFADLPIRAGKNGIEIETNEPKKDAARLLKRFIHLAAHQPLAADEIAIYERLVMAELDRGESFADAMIAGYSAFLCSGHFIYLPRSGQFATASKLSHMFTNSREDPTLRSLATSGKLNKAGLQTETDRLINAPSFSEFVTNFTDHWLSVKDLRRDEPDARLYPEYRFDDYLIESMEAETRAFFTTLVRDNLPITNLVDSDFVLVNDRLARHYELKPVRGSKVRRVQLPPSSPYGGLITQGAILKVTANGTSTSPIVRGAWIMDRILGDPPPLPPKSVPAIEPDIRGATTIRDQLARHAKDATCASCHARFDPVGLAMENFDIMGAWRDKYRSLSRGERITGIDRAGHDYVYFVAANIDSSGQLLDGRKFQNIKELKKMLAANPRQLARNFLHRLTIYATGTPVRFSDRAVIESILDDAAKSSYRAGDLMHGLVQSRIFIGEE